MTSANFGVAQKYFIRTPDGNIDYSQSYDFIASIPNAAGLYFVLNNNSIGYIDRNGKFTIPLNSDYKRINYRGNTVCNDNSLWKKIHDDVTGTTIFVTPVFKNGFVGLIDSTGKELVPCNFAEVDFINASMNYVPVAFLNHLNKRKLLWGLYDIVDKRISTMPADYEKVNGDYCIVLQTLK